MQERVWSCKSCAKTLFDPLNLLQILGSKRRATGRRMTGSAFKCAGRFCVVRSLYRERGSGRGRARDRADGEAGGFLLGLFWPPFGLLWLSWAPRWLQVGSKVPQVGTFPPTWPRHGPTWPRHGSTWPNLASTWLILDLQNL